jgi:signal transduction histidine kinase
MNSSRNLASASGQSEESEPQQLNSVTTPNVPARVLVVEDEPEILEPLAHSLHKAGYEVLRAEDGLTACRSIGSDNPDLVLLDIMLPDLDGWEVCKLLRQHPDPSVAGIPVIMLTALNSPHDKYRGLELGADAFLPKPYSIREVLMQAGNLIRRRRQTVDLENRIRVLNHKQDKSINIHHLLFHELRNQLFILNGYTELLQNSPDTNRVQICKEAIYRSSNYLQTLAEEVLLIRQVEDGGLSLQSEAFDADQMIEDIIKLYDVPAKEKSMVINHVKEINPEFVFLNRTALKIIVSALVDNAIKYGPKGQEISLSCCRRHDRMELIVKDHGPGIPAADQRHIFEPYFRCAEHQNRIHGSGIGLHAVSILSKAMGGEVSLESAPGHGSSFRIQFPAQTKN